MVAAAVAVIGVVLVARDGNGGDAERQEIIDAEITGVWRAAGMEDGEVRNLAYDITRRRGNSRCQGLPRGPALVRQPQQHHDRPRARRRGTAGRRPLTRWLDEQGYTTCVYQTTRGGHLVDGIDDDRGLWVEFTTERDDLAEVMVRLTPCTDGPYLPPGPPGMWTPVDG